MILGVVISYILVFITIGAIYMLKGNVIFKGERGNSGPIGLQGDAGAEGSQGPQGTAGSRGPKGPDGPAWYACDKDHDPEFKILPDGSYTVCGSHRADLPPGTIPTVRQCQNKVPGVSTPAPGAAAEFPWKGSDYHVDKPAGCYRDVSSSGKGTYYNRNLASNTNATGDIKQICRLCVEKSPVPTTL